MKSDHLKFKESLTYSISIIALLWVVKLAEFKLGTDFSYLGIYPRTLAGSLGILTSPLIHGDFRHLISNSFPLIILLGGVIYLYNNIANKVILLIYILTGIVVWIVSRDAYHIGASGIVYGLVSFLFFIGVFRRDPGSMAISMAVVFLYGGMIYGLLPDNPQISYESHIIGSLAGLFTAFVYKKTPMDVHTIEIETIDSNSKDAISNEYKYFFKPDSNSEKDNKIHYRIDL